MPREKIEGLISELHEKLTDSKSSPQQEAMLAQMKSQLNEWEGPKPSDGNFKETAEILLMDIEENHPKAARITREIIEVLSRLGL